MTKHRTSIIVLTIICLSLVLAMVIRGNSLEQLVVDWSPDGQWIVFSCGFFPLSDPQSHLYLIRPNGSQLQRITTDAYIATSPEWSPDGEWIAFLNKKAIFKMKPDGTHVEKVVGTSVLEEIRGFDWSSENQIIFSTQRLEGGGRIYGVQSDGSDLQQLLQQDELISSLAWIAENQRIAFTVPPLGISAGIYIVDLEGEHSFIFKDIQPIGRIDWSEQQTELLVTEFDPNGQNHLYRLNLENEELNSFEVNFFHGSPSWSPDGEEIVFSGTSEDGGNWLQIYRTPLSGGSPERLTDMQDCSATNPRWFDFDAANW